MKHRVLQLPLDFIAELMKLMLRRDAFYNDKFPAISESINYYKRTKGDLNNMRKAVEEMKSKQEL